MKKTMFQGPNRSQEGKKPL